MIRKNGKLIDIATCDWKSPNDLIEVLVEKLSGFGVYAVNVETGGDGCAIAFSNVPITEDEASDANDNVGNVDWDIDKDEALIIAKEK